MQERFKRHQNGRREARPIDGIMHPAKNSGSINFKRSISYQPGNGAIADFSQSNGFNPSQQGVIANSGNSIAAILDPPPKTKLFGSKRTKRKNKIKHPTTRRNWIKPTKKIAMGIFMVAVVMGSFLLIKGYLKAHKIFKGGSNGALALQDNVDPAKLKGEGDGRVNVLLLGKGGAGWDGPDLTDTIMIASIDPLQKEAALLSIPRDFYVKASGYGSYTKINAVYANAKYKVLGNGKQTETLKARSEQEGLAAIEKTVSETMGIPIHYHVMIDFTGFKQAIDTVGGVDLNVSTSLYEVMYINGKNYTLNVKIGNQHFDGFRALAYARSRHASLRGDFDRAERQRSIIVSLKEKILSAGTFTNPLKISQLMDAFGDHIQSNMTIDEMLRLYSIGKDIPSTSIRSVGLADPPNNFVRTANVEGLSVVVPTAGIGNYKNIQSFVRNELKDGFIKNENARVVILNGTNVPGLASNKTEELKSYGYNVVKVADAPTKNYTKTQIIDLTNGSKKYTKKYLEERFMTLSTKIIPEGIDSTSADFVIILGSETANSQN